MLKRIAYNSSNPKQVNTQKRGNSEGYKNFNRVAATAAIYCKSPPRLAEMYPPETREKKKNATGELSRHYKNENPRRKNNSVDMWQSATPDLVRQHQNNSINLATAGVNVMYGSGGNI